MEITTPRTLDDLEFDKLKEIVKQFAASPLGREKLENLNPSTDPSRIERSLQEVEELQGLLRSQQKFTLGEMVDLKPLIEEAREHPPLGPDDFLTIKRTLTTGVEVKQDIIERQEDDIPHLHRIIGEIDPLPELRQRISKVVDRRGEIRDDATPKLRELIEKKRGSEQAVKEKLNDFLDQYPRMVQDRVIARRSNRLVVPIKSSYRNQLQCVIHESSNSGQTLFAEPSSAVELNNKIRDLASEIRGEKKRILRELSNLLLDKERALRRTQTALQELDLIYAKARFGVEYSCNFPKLEETGSIHLVEARHPLLDQDEVVPISLQFGEDSRGGLITGPNTGGKTVTLKTIGLFALMVQSGIPIPASPDSSISIFDGIYSDIGDEQSIEQSLSTFSSHMNNIVEILHRIDEKSLVLLDELGAGTDPQEGAALGLGILEHLLERGPVFSVTTHFTALKNFSFGHPNLATFSVDFDPEELVPTYHILEGVPGRSNAFIIAGRLGLPEEVIDKAEEFLDEKSIQAEDIIQELMEEKREVNRQSSQLKEKLKKAERLKKEYERKLSKLEEDKQQMLDKKLQDVDKFIKEAKKQIEDAIAEAKDKDLEQSRSSRNKISDIEEELDLHQRKLEETFEKPSLEYEELSEGQTVWVKSAQQNGKIVRLKGDDQIVIKAGGLTLETNTQDIEPPKESLQSTQRKTSSSAKHQHEGTSPEMELNVRGDTVREALSKVDLYLDRLIRSQRSKGRILHGKGTGTLRRAIRDHLKDLPGIDSIYSPPPAEGGDGVTVVKLR